MALDRGPGRAAGAALVAILIGGCLGADSGPQRDAAPQSPVSGGAADALELSDCEGFSAGFLQEAGAFDGMLPPGFRPVRRPAGDAPVDAPVDVLFVGGFVCPGNGEGDDVLQVWWHVAVEPPEAMRRDDADPHVAILGLLVSGPALADRYAAWGIPALTPTSGGIESGLVTEASREATLTVTHPQVTLAMESRVAGPPRTLEPTPLSWRVFVIGPGDDGAPTVAGIMDWDEDPGGAMGGAAGALMTLAAEGDAWPFAGTQRSAMGGQFLGDGVGYSNFPASATRSIITRYAKASRMAPSPLPRSPHRHPPTRLRLAA